MDDPQQQPAAEDAHLAAAEQLVAQSADPRAIRQYAETLMRELANPLEAINNLVFVAREDAADPQHVMSYMDMAERQLQRLNDLARRTGKFCQSLKGE